MAPSDPDTTNGNEADSTTEKLTVHVKEAAIPDDPEAQGKILDDIGELVSDALLENHGVESEKVYAGVGHEYTQINDYCPDCGNKLDIFEIRADTENGALASVECPECDYHGTGIYRLIDLESRKRDPETGEEETHSAVKHGETTPQHFIY